MKQYELLYILPGTLVEDELSPTIEKVKEIIVAEGGSIVSVEERGKNRLTYPMKHIRYGYFFLIIFEVEVDAVALIQKKLTMTKDFLRVLINTHDPEKNKKYSEAMVALERRSAQYGNKGRESEAPVVEKKKVEKKLKKEEKKEKKVDMEEINEKLDALLQSDLEKV
jgi:small subunit ribosomal protein S6